MTPGDVAEQLDSIRKAGVVLRRRPRNERLETVGRILDLWADPGSRWRRALVAELPAATGFSAPLVERGLTAGLDHWNTDALIELARQELSDAGPNPNGSRQAVSSFDSTAVVLAGSIPMPTLLSLIAPLVVGSPVIAKVAARDPVTPVLVARSIAEVDSELGDCVAIVNFHREDEVNTQALLEASCVCATGSDATIASLQARVRPPRRILFDGHRLSVAVIGTDCGAASADINETADRVALDVALWDQLGCLSPVVVFAVGNEKEAAEAWADRFSDALATALTLAEQQWPRGEVEPGSARDIVRERSEAELRAAAGQDVRLLASDSTAWTVIRENNADLRRAPLHRFVRVVPISDPRALTRALAPYGSHLAAVAVEGFGDQISEVCGDLVALGASRICRPGTMQSPPLGWHHAGRGVLSSLARFSDIEGAL